MHAGRGFLVWTAIVIVAGVVGLAEAQVDCATQPGNVILNCGFDVDLTWWGSIAADSFTHTLADGDGSPGAGVVDALEVNPGSFNARIGSTACVSGPTPEFEAGLAFKVTSGGSGSTQCRFSVLWYDDNCAVFVDGDLGPWFQAGPAWARRGHSFGTVPGPLFSLMVLECEDTVDFTVVFDDAVVAPDWIPVELQSLTVD